MKSTVNLRNSRMLINNRHVPILDIVEQRVTPLDDFEEAVFACIREWNSNTNTFVFHTSGSTGAPTALTFARDQLIRSAQSTAAAFGLRNNDTALVCLRPSFVAGRMMIVRALVIGMKIVAVTPSSNPLVNLSEDQQIDFAAVVPLQLQAMIEAGLHERLKRIRTILVGGAPVSRYLRQLVLDNLNGNVFQTYGMTETLTHVALDHITGSEEAFDAMPGVVLGQDERGCLTVTSPVVGRKVVTNDIVELLNKNRFRWLGRYDNVINSGGVKIIPEQIERKVEAAFGRLNIQNRFIAAGVPDERLGSALVLIVESEQQEGLKEKLVHELARVLNTYENPRKIHFLPSFVYTMGGKINRMETIKRVNRIGMEKP
jgi:O-succinylbenzoic acid--CoA ligase